MSQLPNEHRTALRLGGAVETAAPLVQAPHWATLVREQQVPLLQYVRRLINSQQDAEDVVQDAFARLFKLVQTDGAATIANPVSWLYRVAHNRAMDLRRRRKRRVDHHERVRLEAQVRAEHQAPAQRAESDIVEQEAISLALSLLDELPDEQQQIIVLKVMQGKTLREVSEILDMPLGNVNYRLNKALSLLAERLKAKGAI